MSEGITVGEVRRLGLCLALSALELPARGCEVRCGARAPWDPDLREFVLGAGGEDRLVLAVSERADPMFWRLEFRDPDAVAFLIDGFGRHREACGFAMFHDPRRPPAWLDAMVSACYSEFGARGYRFTCSPARHQPSSLSVSSS